MFNAAPLGDVASSLWRVPSVRIDVAASWRARSHVVVVLAATLLLDGPQRQSLPLVRLLRGALFRCVGALLLDLPSPADALHGLSSVQPLFNRPWSTLRDPSSRVNTQARSRKSNCASSAGADAWRRMSGANLRSAAASLQWLDHKARIGDAPSAVASLPRSPCADDSDAAPSALAGRDVGTAAAYPSDDECIRAVLGLSVREPLVLMLNGRLAQLLADPLAPVLNESFAPVRDGSLACAVPLLDDSGARVLNEKLVPLFVVPVRDIPHAPVVDDALGPMLHEPFDPVLNGPLESVLLQRLLNDCLVPLLDVSFAGVLDEGWVPVVPLLVDLLLRVLDEAFVRLLHGSFARVLDWSTVPALPLLQHPFPSGLNDALARELDDILAPVEHDALVLPLGESFEAAVGNWVLGSGPFTQFASAKLFLAAARSYGQVTLPVAKHPSSTQIPSAAGFNSGPPDIAARRCEPPAHVALGQTALRRDGYHQYETNGRIEVCTHLLHGAVSSVSAQAASPPVNFPIALHGRPNGNAAPYPVRAVSNTAALLASLEMTRKRVSGLLDVDAVGFLDCASFIPSVPLLSGSIAPVRDDALVPVLNRSLAPLDVSFARALEGALVPVLNRALAPPEVSFARALEGALVPVLNRALAPPEVSSRPVGDAALAPVVPWPDGGFPRALYESFARALDRPFARVWYAALVPVVSLLMTPLARALYGPFAPFVIKAPTAFLFTCTSVPVVPLLDELFDPALDKSSDAALGEPLKHPLDESFPRVARAGFTAA
ncbi:hypothetical protein AURDEDRAFT_156676 [Auricularia subglabra TFB-10046 SS5]|nr:hypothetical protein AURDEDRAFT_156676 [Auricularia subglabra TFB-10046 SS5]